MESELTTLTPNAAAIPVDVCTPVYDDVRDISISLLRVARSLDSSAKARQPLQTATCMRSLSASDPSM